MIHHHWTRRTFVGASAALALAAPARAQPRVRIVATGLQAPESPKPQADGSVILVEMARGTLSRVSPAGVISVIADLGGSPNGAAIGPDGAAYVCNSGGLIFKPQGDLLLPSGSRPGAVSTIQRVDLKTGAFSTLYSQVDGAPLQGPNDLVFDARGGFWFTAPRAPGPGGQNGALYWALPDGSSIKRIAWLVGANGIAIAPDGNTLLAVQSGPGKLQAFQIVGQGRLAVGADGEPVSRQLWDSAGANGFDSMAVDAAGNAVVGTLQHGDIAASPREGVITVIAPDGSLVEKVPMPDRYVTSIGFGGPGLRTAYASLTTTGRLAAVDWPRPGRKLLY